MLCFLDNCDDDDDDFYEDDCDDDDVELKNWLLFVLKIYELDRQRLIGKLKQVR